MASEKFVELSSGETLVIKAIEITQIPSMSIIKGDYSPEINIDDEYRVGFGNLLEEVYRGVKRRSSEELTLELLWLTEPAINQPYQANIRMFIVFRAVGNNLRLARETVDGAIASFSAALRLHKYSFTEIDISSVYEKSPAFSAKRIYSITKDYQEANLDNPLLASCFSYDVFSGFANDLSILTNCLIDHPYCAVSFLLTPTSYSFDETSEIGRIAQILDTLSRGIMAQGIGNVSFSAAGKVADTYRYYQENQNAALFTYSILVYGAIGHAEEVSSRLQGFISYNPNHSVTLKQTVQEFLVQENRYALPWIINEIIFQTESVSMGMVYGNRYQSISRLPFVITADEASGFFRLPIGTQRISAGFNVNESDNGNKTYGNNLINAGDIEIGVLKSSGKDTIGIQLGDLTKHMLVAGTPAPERLLFLLAC